MLLVAEHINEVKKKQDAVNRVVGKDKTSQRRESSRSISSSVTKKLLRSSQKAKTAFGFPDNGGDEMFDTLVALVDSTRSGVLRFSNEMRDWTKSTKAALEAQVNMVEGWIQMYAPMAGERHSAASVSHRRLCIFLDEVLIPIIELPWRELVRPLFPRSFQLSSGRRRRRRSSLSAADSSSRTRSCRTTRSAARSSSRPTTS